MSEFAPKALLERFGLRAKRHFGQNFLADAALAGRIAALVPEHAGVIEIGAGLGALTRPLLARVASVVAIERDRDLVPALGRLFEAELAQGRLRIQEADAKALDWSALARTLPTPHVLAGNLPYQISGPLLERAVHQASQFATVVFLLQHELALRLGAPPGSHDYGALSVFVQAAFAVETAFVVRRGAFYPQPGVDSAVVRLTPLALPIRESDAFRALVHGAFGQRRKQLRNAWNGVLGKGAAELQAAAERAGIDLALRGEVLSVADFARMARELDA